MANKTAVKFREAKNVSGVSPAIENGTFTFDSNEKKLYLDLNDTRSTISAINASGDYYTHGIEYQFEGNIEFQRKVNNSWRSVENNSISFHTYFTFINQENSTYNQNYVQDTLIDINRHIPLGDGAGYIITGTIYNHTYNEVYTAYRIVHSGSTSNNSSVVWCNNNSVPISDSGTEGRLYITPKSALKIYTTVNPINYGC